MKLRCNVLTLQCRRSREIIEFSPRINFFHGKISSGKSSIARLIDFCLGADVEKTPAIQQEAVSVTLLLDVGEYEVLLEREARGSNQVQITWRSANEQGSLIAPLDPAEAPIFGSDVYNLSDLLFRLLGSPPPMVRKNKRDEDAPLIRLSFRDVMWYCYLRQDRIDSNFYHLGDPIVAAKSRDVMRFVVGYWTERLNDLEIRLQDAQQGRRAKLDSARQLRSFLKEFGFESEERLEDEITSTRLQLENAKGILARIQEGTLRETHTSDELRERLRALAAVLENEEEALADLRARLSDQESLRSELVSTKFKLARVQVAGTILSGVSFQLCPACGRALPPVSEDECRVCRQEATAGADEIIPEAEGVRRDLNSRIAEIDDSILRHRRALSGQQKQLAAIKVEKGRLDAELNRQVAAYNSAHMEEYGQAQRNIAANEERLRNLERVRRMPAAITELEREADQLLATQEELKREIERERGTLTNAESFVEEIESAWIEGLQAVGVPGVHPTDVAYIDRRSWVPWVLPEGEESLRWNFFNAGSGGKKTLMNAIYALAVHRVAARRGLPLPHMLMLDTPMKNISHEVNRETFARFYDHLYGLAEGELAKTQFILIDNDYVPPASGTLDVKQRFMTPDNPDHPPLISYYRGQ